MTASLRNHHRRGRKERPNRIEESVVQGQRGPGGEPERTQGFGGKMKRESRLFIEGTDKGRRARGKMRMRKDEDAAITGHK